MAFGQSSGPPATARQIRELLDLLEAAGHTDFRDARGPLGFTQRQAGGKFTRDEADAFIAQLDRRTRRHDDPRSRTAPTGAGRRPYTCGDGTTEGCGDPPRAAASQCVEPGPRRRAPAARLGRDGAMSTFGP